MRRPTIVCYPTYMRVQADRKYPLQFRIGRRFLDRIGTAAENEGVSRNTWIMEAIQRRLKRPGKSCRWKVSAQELMSDRLAIMVRVDALTLDLLNEAAADEGTDSRTIWIIDACLASLARRGW